MHHLVKTALIKVWKRLFCSNRKSNESYFDEKLGLKIVPIKKKKAGNELEFLKTNMVFGHSAIKLWHF